METTVRPQAAPAGPCDVHGPAAFQRFDAAAITRELKRLRGETAAGATPEKPARVTRACLVNVVVLCASEDEARRAEEMVARLSPQRPCRLVLVLLLHKAAASSLEARVTTRCTSTAAGGRIICCEEIVVRASGDSAELAASTVPPLLVAELPVVAWWTADVDLGDETAGRILDIADRVVVESARARAPVARLKQLATLLDEHAVRAGPCDLEWARIQPWRERVAEFFDSPAFTRHAFRIGSARVEYARGATDNPVGAWLLAGWVASRLKPGTVARTEVAVTGGSPAGGVQSVVLEADRAEPPATFRAARIPNSELGRVEVDTPISCPLPQTVRISEPDPIQSLYEVLEGRRRDVVFEEALLEAATRAAP